MIFRQQFVIETPLPVEEAWKFLLPVMKTDRTRCAQCGQSLAGATSFCSYCGLPVAPNAQPQFEGEISAQQFNITRIINYRNSCIPVIRGRFEPSATGTRIVIEMKMHPLGWVLLVGFSTVSFFALSILALNYQGLPVTAMLAFGGPIFIALVCWAAFTAEANTARAVLSRFWPVL